MYLLHLNETLIIVPRIGLGQQPKPPLWLPTPDLNLGMGLIIGTQKIRYIASPYFCSTTFLIIDSEASSLTTRSM